MSLLKKTVSYLVIITMLLSLAVYAQDTQTTEVEIIDEAEIEIEFLKTLGIINERDMGQYIPSNTITRAEFSYMAVKMLGLGEGIELPEEETGFEDVSASHWAAPYIYKASISGIISGNGDGMFNPDQPVLYVQAIRMLVSALGYNVRAELSGGYPVGYLMIAQDKGITLPVSMDSELKKSEVARLVFDTLNVPMLIQESYGSGDIRYSSYEDRTLLSEKLSIYRNEGIVYDDGITRLDGESTHSTARVSIKNYDGTFNTYDRDEGVDVSSLIGYYIVYFYQKNNNQNIGNLVYMYPDNNISLQLDADDILEYKDNTYTYIDEKDETTTVALSNSSYMIYNGKAFLPSHSRDMVPEDGNVVLVDNDSNGMYDIVLINDYKTVCVEAIITDTKSIRDRYRLHNVDLTGDNVKIYKEGSEIEFEDIKRWDILSIAESKGTASDKLVRVFVSSEYIDGNVTEKVTGNIDTIYINGEGYEVAYNLRLVPSIINGIELNENYSFQLDINGKIAAVVEDVLSMDEYIFATGISTGKGISDSIQIKAFTYNETFEILETVNKPQVNGVQLNKNSEIYGLLGNSAGQFEPQLLKIKRNNQDKITTIYSGKAESEHGLEFFGAGSASYKTTNGIFGGIFSITEMSRVFVIPSQDNMNDEELFSTARASEIIDGEYSYRAYDVDDNLIAKVVVLSGDVAPNFGNDDYVGVVIRKSTMIDEKGEERTRVYFLHRNIEKSYLLDRNVTYVGNRPALDIGKGDVFRFYVDPVSDTITHLCRHFDFKNRDSQLGEAQANNPDAPSPNYGNLLRFVYADVVSKSGSTIRARVKKADGNYETYLFSMVRSNITLCRVRGEEIVQVSPGSVGDMRDFETIGDWDKTSKVFMRQRYGEVMDAVIYNFE